MRQPDAKTTFNLRDNTHNVHRVESEPFAQVRIVFEVRVLLARVGFEEFDEGLANRLAVRHDPPSWLKTTPVARVHIRVKGRKKTSFAPPWQGRFYGQRRPQRSVRTISITVRW